MYDIQAEIIKELIEEVEHLKARCDIASERIDELEKRWKQSKIEHSKEIDITGMFDGLQI
jgi:hypothetical protein